MLFASVSDASNDASAAAARESLEEASWAFAYWQGQVEAVSPAFALPRAPKISLRFKQRAHEPAGAMTLFAYADPGAVTLELSGSGWERRTAHGETILARNAAHEVAHVLQYRHGEAHRAPRWLHEGFADALAHEVMADEGRAEGWGGGERCARVLRRASVRSAQNGGDEAALYDCGSLAIRAVADAREESVQDLYAAFAENGLTEEAFLALAAEASPRFRRSVEAFLRTDYSLADPLWVLRELRAGRL